MTGARERRCTLRSPAPRRRAPGTEKAAKEAAKVPKEAAKEAASGAYQRMSNVPLRCGRIHLHIRGDVHLHTKVRRLSQWAQCTHFQRVHVLLYVHTRSGCGIPGNRGAVLSWPPQLKKKGGKTSKS